MSEKPTESASWPRAERFPDEPGPSLHLWRIDLRALDPEGAGAVLDAGERERASRLRSKAARARFTVARAALRSILSRYARVPPDALRFEYADGGKPCLEGPGQVSFNLSHSGDMALCAVTGSGEVGVDVEQLRPLRDVERLVQRHFAPHERAAWLALPSGDRVKGFYRTWTRKEAMLKAAGVGLARPLERVDTLAGRLEDEVYWVGDVEPGEGYAAAVASARPPERVERWSWCTESS